MLDTKFSPWPSFTKEEADAVSQTLLSNKVNYWTGTESREFEKEFAKWSDTEFAIALANGTVALDLALHALGIGPGDEVVVTPRTFLASVSSVVIAGATPVFADVDRNTQALSADTISKVISPKTKAVIVVHLAGTPADMDPIMELATKRGFAVIEDCAQAHGAKYKGRPVGSIGDIGCWSFCQDKIMTTGGEGGMVTTNNHDHWRIMWSFKDHGKSFSAVYEREHPPGFRWLHESFGTNWRMTELQSVIGRIQLRRMKEWTQARQNNSKALADVCSQFSCVRLPVAPAQSDDAAYKFYFFINPELLANGWTRDRIVAEVSAAGVPCMQGSCSEVYLEKAFDGTSFRPLKRLPIAKELGETSVMMLVHPTLTSEEIATSCTVLSDVLGRSRK